MSSSIVVEDGAVGGCFSGVLAPEPGDPPLPLGFFQLPQPGFEGPTADALADALAALLALPAPLDDGVATSADALPDGAAEPPSAGPSEPRVEEPVGTGAVTAGPACVEGGGAVSAPLTLMWTRERSSYAATPPPPIKKRATTPTTPKKAPRFDAGV